MPEHSKNEYNNRDGGELVNVESGGVDDGVEISGNLDRDPGEAGINVKATIVGDPTTDAAKIALSRFVQARAQSSGVISASTDATARVVACLGAPLTEPLALRRLLRSAAICGRASAGIMVEEMWTRQRSCVVVIAVLVHASCVILSFIQYSSVLLHLHN